MGYIQIQQFDMQEWPSSMIHLLYAVVYFLIEREWLNIYDYFNDSQGKRHVEYQASLINRELIFNDFLIYRVVFIQIIQQCS